MNPPSELNHSKQDSVIGAPMLRTVPVLDMSDILPQYRETPIAELLASHNLGRALPVTPAANLLIITCMDHRIALDIPERFAYQIRTAGANPSPVFSNVAFALGAAGINAICVIGHTDCAMCKVSHMTGTMTKSLVDDHGWEMLDARDQEIMLHQVFALDDSMRTAWDHAARLAKRFPRAIVAPLLYRVEDGALVQIDQLESSIARAAFKTTDSESWREAHRGQPAMAMN